MCDITTLLEFGIFGTNGTNTDAPQDATFALNRTCAQVADPFAQYCLIPPITRIPNTCELLDDKKQPVSLFQKLFNGQLKTLEDLPNIFQTFPIANNTQDIWIRRDDISPNQKFPNGTYNGFQPVPNTVTRLAVSNIIDQKLLCFLSAQSNSNFQLYMLDNYGFFRLQFTVSGMLMETTSADLYYNCFSNANGTNLFALLQQTCYFFVVGTNTWDVFPGVPNTIRNVLLRNSDIVMTSDMAIYFIQPLRPTIFFDSEKFAIWSCWTLDFRHVAVGLFVDLTHQEIHIYSIDTGTRVAQWNMTTGFDVSNARVYSAGAMGAYDNVNPLSIRVTNNLQPTPPALIITLSPGNPNASFLTTLMLATHIFDKYFIGNDGSIVNNGNGITIIPPLSPGPLPVTTALASATDDLIWFLLDGVLWQVYKETAWSTPSNIYMGAQVSINDDYDPASTPAEVWYTGRAFFNMDVTPTIPSVFHNSRHNHYRLVFDELKTNPSVTFPFIQTHVEQANEYFLFTNFAVKIYEDANIVIEDNLGNVIWETNTHDKASDPTMFHIWISRSLPLSTTNGLYLLYFVNNVGAHLAYNVYNSPSLAQFCKQDLEFRARALEQQRDFCFANLRVDTGIGAPMFADARCACVGGTALFEATFPALTSLHSQTTGRMVADLPCLLTDCGESFLNGPELSNSYLSTSDRCQQSINVCSEIINLPANSNLNLNNLLLQQYCGTDPTACLTNESCPIGQTCIDGKCTMLCGDDAFCRASLQNPVAVCTAQGRCEFPPNPKTQQQKNNWLIFSIVCIVLILVFVILLLAFFVDNKKK